MQQAGLSYRERRDKHRLPFVRQVQITSPSAGALQLQGVDYSPCGIAVACPCPLPPGEQLVLHFPVGRNLLTEMEVGGEVMHSSPKNDSFIIGIRFLERIDSP